MSERCFFVSIFGNGNRGTVKPSAGNEGPFLTSMRRCVALCTPHTCCHSNTCYNSPLRSWLMVSGLDSHRGLSGGALGLGLGSICGPICRTRDPFVATYILEARLTHLRK